MIWLMGFYVIHYGHISCITILWLFIQCAKKCIGLVKAGLAGSLFILLLKTLVAHCDQV